MKLALGTLLLSLLAADAWTQSPPDMQAALEACAALPERERDDCMETLFAPDPEEAARMQAAQRATQTYHLRISEALAARATARDLTLAAILRRLAAWSGVAAGGGDPSTARLPPDARAQGWLAGAANATGAQDDVLLQTLLVAADADDRAGLRARAAARWQVLEPDNLAAWLAGGQPGPALAASMRVTRHDSHFYPRVRLIADALAAFPPTADERVALLPPDARMDHAQLAVIAALGIDLAVAIPAFQGLTQQCRDPALVATPGRPEACRQVARVLVTGSDTVLAESVGIGMLDRLAVTPAEQAEARHLRRGFDWRMQQRIPLDGEDGTNFFRLFRDPSVRDERELTERMLREAGIPPEPPPGWQPPRPR